MNLTSSSLVVLLLLTPLARPSEPGPDNLIKRSGALAQRFTGKTAYAEQPARLPAADPAWTVVGRDDPLTGWRDFWTLDGENARVERTATGFEFRAGPRRGEDADHAVLWTRASYAGDVKLTFDYTRTDEAVRDVNILYIHAQGTGDGPYAADLAQWAELRRVPAMRIYFQNLRAWHLSYAAFVNTGPVGQPDYIRVRRYPVTPERPFAETEVPPTIEGTGLFKTGVTYAVTVIKTATTLQLQVRGDGQDRSFSWDLSSFDGPNEGRIGLRHMHTRAARYDGFTIYQRRPAQVGRGAPPTPRSVVVSDPVVQPTGQGLLTATVPTPDAVIRYTLDGTDPTKDAGLWLAPVDVPAGYVLKARAFSRDGASASGVVTVPGLAAATRRASTLVPVTQNRDWRTYDWAERHSAGVALMRERRPEIVMLGDSITHFWGGDPVGGRRTGADVWERCFAGRSVVNLGYGWDRTENVLWRLTHGEFEQARPKVVVVMIGTNNMGLNTSDEIAAGIEAICGEIHRRSPATRILLLGIFPRGAKPDATRAKVRDVNERIAKFDGRNGITYLDIGDRFLEPDGTISREIMYDYLHPSAKGYAIWAEAMEPTLRRLLEEPAR